MMWNDDSGVAGFFEDLPVLLFVLGGTMLLVSSGLWTSARLEEQRLSDGLRELTGRAVDSVTDRLASLAPVQGVPTLEAIERSNLTGWLREIVGTHHFAFNISDLCRPERWSLALDDGFRGETSDTGFARRLMTGLDGSGLLVILEVRLIVWKD